MQTQQVQQQAPAFKDMTKEEQRKAMESKVKNATFLSLNTNAYAADAWIFSEENGSDQLITKEVSNDYLAINGVQMGLNERVKARR